MNRSSISRDLKKQCSKGVGVPQLYDVLVPIYNSKRKIIAGFETSAQPVILPHELFGWIYDKYPEKFQRFVLGNRSRSSIAKFWKGFRDDDDLIWGHPCFQGDYDLGSICPISSHSDGVPVTKPGAGSMSLYVTSLSSPFSIGKTSDSHWLFSVIPSNITQKKKTSRGNETLEPMLKVYNWSMSALNSGKYPSTDHMGHAWADDDPRAKLAGSCIAGGWKFCNWQHRGDLDMAANELRLAHWSCHNTCARCPCLKKGRMSFLDFKPDAPWKPQSYTNATWTSPHSEFWNGPGVKMRTYALDPAHTLDKGISQYMLGSIFKELVYGHVLAPRSRDLEPQVQVLWNLIREFYDRTRCPDRLDKLTLKCFTNPKKPHQEQPCFAPGNMTKCRRLIPFGLELAEKFSDASRHDQHRIAAFKHLDSVYTQIFESPDFLSEHESTQLQISVDGFLAHQNWLFDYGVQSGEPLYSVTIKSHYLWHMAKESVWYSPRLSWTYSDEDYVGKIASLCRSVTRSVPNVQRPRKLLEKWLLAMAVQWSEDGHI